MARFEVRLCSVLRDWESGFKENIISATLSNSGAGTVKADILEFDQEVIITMIHRV